jgi:hypothetical protein
MLKAPIKALSVIAIALFIFLTVKPAVAEDFYYRGPKLNPEQSTSALFLTPVRKLDRNTFTLDLVVDPSGKQINTVSTEISFPADRLSLIDLSKTDSFCSFFVEENIDNDQGKIRLSCVAPYPGTDKMSNVISLTFRQAGTGPAELSLSPDSLVLANDGYGTNVLKSLGGQTVD